MVKTIFKAKRDKRCWILEDGGSRKEAETTYQIKSIKLYNRFFIGLKEMFGFFFEFDLTKLERDILDILLDTLETNNLLFYNEQYYAQLLGVHTGTVRKCMAKLSRMNIFKRLKRQEDYSILMLSPHLMWMGDPEIGQNLIKGFPLPVYNSVKNRLDIIEQHKKWVENIQKKERKLKVESICAYSVKPSHREKSVTRSSVHIGE